MRLIASLAMLLLANAGAYAVTVTVTNTNDSGVGSLREALALIPPGQSTTIQFNIPGAGARTIQLTSPLPLPPGPIVIDGTTQPGYAGSPLIYLDGSAAGVTAIGLSVGFDGSLIKGMGFGNFSGSAIVIVGASAVFVEDCYIGVGPDGQSAMPNEVGVTVSTAADGNEISDNIIAGNDVQIYLRGSGTQFNVIQHNHLGVGVTGATRVAGSRVGVQVEQGASANLIGGESGTNVISGLSLSGVVLSGSAVTGNIIQGNLIGFKADTTGTVAGSAGGIMVTDGANGNLIGGAEAGKGNRISGHSEFDVLIEGTGVTANVVMGNYIGVGTDGATSMGGKLGIYVGGGAAGNVIGGSTTGERNVIGGHTHAGIVITDAGTTLNLISGNHIGVNAAATGPIAGSKTGIFIVEGASDNLIGGSASAAGNLIGGHSEYGILVNTSSDNFIQNNRIGGVSLVDGLPAIPNAIGINLGAQATGNVVGSSIADTDVAVMSAKANHIANNFIGIVVDGAGNDLNTIRGNRIRGNSSFNLDIQPSLGPNSNDAGDVDVGPNGLQNRPVITLASRIGTSTRVTGTLNSQPNSTFIIDLYAVPAADAHASGHGGGTYLMKALTVLTDGAGNASFDVTVPVSPSESGQFVTATATSIAGSTSEFSANAAITDGTPPQVAITTPGNNAFVGVLAAITGTASDEAGGSGLAPSGAPTISLTLAQGGDYWNGTAWVSTVTSVQVPVNGDGTWSFTSLPTGGNARNGLHTVGVSADDNAGNHSVPQGGVTARNFTVDAVPPSGTITAPSADAFTPTFPVITGTATDNAAIAAVTIHLRREIDGKYWTGSSWVSFQTSLSSNYNPTNETFTGNFAMPTLGVNAIGGEYTYFARPTDGAGNSAEYSVPFTVTYHATFTWSGAAVPANNLWNDPDNWSSSLPAGLFVPGSQDIAIIPSGQPTYPPSPHAKLFELHLTGGTLAVDTLSISNALQFSSGTFNGQLDLQPNTQSVWLSGRLTGQLNIAEGAMLSMPIAGSSYKYLGAAGKPGTINNAGTMVWSSAYSIYGRGDVGGEATINNLPSGVFEVTWAGDPFSYEASAAGCVFNNQGRFVRSGGTGPSNLAYYWTFNNEPGAVIECTPLGATIARNAGQPTMLKAGSVFRGAGTIALAYGTIQAEAGNWIIEGGAVLDLNGATIEGPQTGSLTPAVAAGSGLRWSSGRITGNLDIAPGITLQMPIAGSSYKYLGAAGKPGTINNAGTMVWSSDYQISGYGGVDGGAIINNLPTGVFEVTRAGDPFSYDTSAAGCVFNNQGRFVRSGGTGYGNFAYYWAFNNEPGAVIECTPVGATLAHDGSAPMLLKAGSVFRGAGTIALAYGTIQAEAGNWIIEGGAVLDLKGATIEGPQTGSLTPAVAAGSGLRWSSGRITGNLDIAPGITLQMPIAGSSNKYLGAAGKPGTINNAGTMVWSSDYQVSGYGGVDGGAIINNLPTGVFEVTRDAVPLNYEASAAGCVFNNQGFIVKSAGSGTAAFNYYWTFNNTGQVGSLSGVLSFPGTSAFNDGSVFNSGFGGSCAITGGTATFRGTSLILGGPLAWQGGTVAGHADGTAVINGGILEWSGSILGGTLRFGPTANVQASSSSSKVLAANAAVSNAGNFTWLAGSMVGNGNATFTNMAGGTFNAPAGGYFSYNSAGNIFTNSGTLNIGASPGTLNFSSQWSFVQNASGRLNIEIGGTSTSQFDRLLCSGPVTLGGTLRVDLINGFVPVIDNTFDIITYASRTGTFASFNSPGAHFSRSYNAGALRLTATDAPSDLEEWKDAYFEDGSPEAADDADPDFDGVPNLLEFATGGNPLSASPAGELVSPPSGGVFEFYYTRSIIALAELTFEVQWTDDLLPPWQTTGVTEEILGDNGSVQQVKATIPAGNSGCRFVHLKVTRP